jgi:hypothetical protein
MMQIMLCLVEKTESMKRGEQFVSPYCSIDHLRFASTNFIISMLNQQHNGSIPEMD